MSRLREYGRKLLARVRAIKPPKLPAIKAPAIPPAVLSLVAEVGFVALFLTGLALKTDSATALIVAGVLGVFAVERNGKKKVSK